jgi:exosome complex component RRP41
MSELIDENGLRLDGRKVDELRPITIKAGVLNEADGSAFIHWGGNKIVVGVYGPRPCIPRHEANPYKAIIKARYMMAPFCSKEERGRTGPTRRSIEISKVIREAFEHVVLTRLYPKTEIDIFIEVLQAHGGTRTAAITAATVALIDAGIPLKDMVAAVSVGKIDGRVVVDLSKEEDNYGQGDMPVAMTHRTKEVVLLQMDGLFTREEFKQGLSMAEKALDYIHELQVKAVKEKYEEMSENVLKL